MRKRTAKRERNRFPFSHSNGNTGPDLNSQFVEEEPAKKKIKDSAQSKKHTKTVQQSQPSATNVFPSPPLSSFSQVHCPPKYTTGKPASKAPTKSYQAIEHRLSFSSECSTPITSQFSERHATSPTNTSSHVVDGLRDEIRSVQSQILTNQNIQHEKLINYLDKIRDDINKLRKEMREISSTVKTKDDGRDDFHEPADELPKHEKIGNVEDFNAMESRFISTSKEDVALKKKMVSNNLTHTYKERRSSLIMILFSLVVGDRSTH